MTYIQFVIQEGNIELFREIMATPTGIADLISSRDLHGNTCLHYIALFDQEDFILQLLKQIDQSQSLGFKLKTLAEEQNAKGRTALDFFKRGKSDSYEFLQQLLMDMNEVGGPSENIRQIKQQIKTTRELRKSSSTARLPSQSSTNGSTTNLNQSLDKIKISRTLELSKSQRSFQSSGRQTSLALAPI